MTFDPAKVSYEKLLDVFWVNHDPTVNNRQFCDSGTQYRPEIFYHSDEQKQPRRGLQGEMGEAEALQAADPDRDHQGGRVLSRRGLPPGLLQEERRCSTSSTSRAAAATRGSTACGATARQALAVLAHRIVRSSGLSRILSAGSSSLACCRPMRSAFRIACFSSSFFGSALRAAFFDLA